jgi:hypothetical protein
MKQLGHGIADEGFVIPCNIQVIPFCGLKIMTAIALVILMVHSRSVSVNIVKNPVSSGSRYSLLLAKSFWYFS